MYDVYHYFSLQIALNKAFNAAFHYSNTFEPHREFYRQNESLDLDAVRSQDHGKYMYIMLVKCNMPFMKRV